MRRDRRPAAWSAAGAACASTTPTGCRPAGGVILAANHIGIIDGPLLAIFAPATGPRADQAGDVRTAAPDGSCGRSGQIPLDRFHADPRARPHRLRVLRDGGVAGVFPEGTRGDGELHRFHHGAAYLALVTGAPGRAPVTARHPRARRWRRLASRRAATPSTWSSATVADGTTAVAAHAGNGSADLGVAPGADAVRAGRGARGRRRRPARAAACRDNPRTTPTPGSSTEEHHMS